MSIRTARVAEEIQKVLGERLIRGLRDPLPGFVTIRGVEVTSDFTHAKVFVSVFGSDAQKQGAIAGLQQQRGALRHEVGQKIRLRNTPNLTFVLDESSERAARVHALLDEVKAHDAQLAKQQTAPPAQKPVETPKSAEAPKPVETPKPVEVPKPTPNVVEAKKPIEAPKPAADLNPALPRASLSSSVERGAVETMTSAPAPSAPKAAGPTPAKKAATKKATTKKAATKKAATKKATAKKATTKKAATKKAPGKKATAKKAATKKAATKKATAKKAATKKATTKKATKKVAKQKG